MKIFNLKSLLPNKEKESGVEDMEWGAALSDLYNNELADNEEQWEVVTNEKGNKTACLLKQIKEDSV